MSRSAFSLLAFSCFVAIAAAAGGVFFLAVPPSAPAQATTMDEKAEAPLVEAPETTHDFGVMDPFSVGRHTFVLYNRGDAPLKLTKGETTCRCTLSDLEDDVVPPGGMGRITLEWHTQKIRNEFAHAAEIRTNDPEKPSLELRVRGTVRHSLTAAPEGLAFDSLGPGEQATRSFFVYSQTWKSFSLQNVQITMPGAEWKVREATPDDLKNHRATSGLHVDVTLPGDMQTGRFSGSIAFDARASESDESTPGELQRQHYEVLFAGNVARAICVYGLEFSLSEELFLGSFVEGERKEWNGVIKLRGERQTIEVQSIETVPSWLQVSVTPYLTPQGEPKPGLYRFQIVLPESAEPGTYNDKLGEGKIVVRTDHPLDPVLEIPVTLTVLSAQAK